MTYFDETFCRTCGQTVPNCTCGRIRQTLSTQLNALYRCRECKTLWRQWINGTWSLEDAGSKPGKCCDNAPDFLSKLEYPSESALIGRIRQFQAAIERIAWHVGACCGGVDTEGYGPGGHTAAEIIRCIDAKVAGIKQIEDEKDFIDSLKNRDGL